jgi:hypothetical protein
VLGGPADVERFVRTASELLGAPLDDDPRGARLPVDHLPEPVRERIALDGRTRLLFDRAGPSGTAHIHRGHPLVRALAEHVAESVLAGDTTIASRCGALFTGEVDTRTLLLLLRLRSQIETARSDGEAPRHLLAEECVVAHATRGSPLELLDDERSRRLLATPAAKDMPPEQRRRTVEAGLALIEERRRELDALAAARAEALLADHTRVRDAAIGRRATRGYRIEVRPCLPVDVLGVWVLVPAAGL